MEVLKEEKKEAVYNMNLNAPFTKETSGVRESVSTETGEVIVRNSIFHIPGRGGMDVSLNLEYRSRDAKVYEEGTKSASIANNYGQNIIAYYDVFDSNHYWLRTGALKYTTGEPTILTEVTIDSQKWVFTGYLQYETGTSILSSGNIINTPREKSLVSAAKYIFGEGWSLDMPCLDVDGEEDVYVHLPNGQTYKVDFGNGVGLKDYELTDIIFTKDTSSGNGMDTSAYKLYYISGHSYYFSGKGELILEKDRFDNKISYYWQEIGGKRLLTQVVDSVGRSVDILYNDTVTLFQSGDRSVSLIKTPIPGETGKYYLSSFIDTEGRETKYGYSFDSAAFDALGKTAANNLYVNLVDITYPTGAKTKYTYNKSIKNLGNSGFMEYFKVKERCDVSGDKTYNLLSYNYYNEPDGYPLYKVSAIDELYQYYATVMDSNGIITKYMYNGKHQGYLKEQQLDNRLLSQIKTDYHAKYNLPIKVTSKTFNEKEDFSEKISSYDYDHRGNLLVENHPLSREGQALDAYKTFYTYDYPYNLLTGKRYKQDENTNIEIEYSLREDKKAVTEEKIYSNNNLISNKAFTYDVYGNVLSLSAEKNPGTWVTTQYEYSNNYKGAYLTKLIFEDVVDADGHTRDIKQGYSYDFSTGNKLTETDGNNQKVAYSYDKLGRITRKVLPGNMATTYDYEDENNVLKITDGNKNELVYYYDKLGKLMKVIEPVKNITLVRLSYDENENIVLEEDGNHNIKEYTYDPLKRIIEVKNTDSKGNLLSQTKATYEEAYKDRFENTYFMVTVTNKGDSKDIVNHYYFDAFDRLVKQGRMEGKQEDIAQFKYDYLGNQIQAINFASEKMNFEYDALGRLTQEMDAEKNKTSYEYDHLGNVIARTDALGETIFFEYDNLGRKILQKTPFEEGKYSITRLYYDGAGNLHKIIDPEGYLTRHYYNKQNRLEVIEQVISSDESYLTKVDYDKAGNIKSITKGLHDINDENYSKVSYQYDELNRLITFIDEGGNETEYSYDNNNNLIQTLDRNEVVTTYTYDGLNRLVHQYNSKDGSKTAVNIAYDKLGNTAIIMDESGRRDLAYDNLGRLKEINYNDGVRTSYDYDKADRITKLQVQQGSAEEMSLSYSYDQLGRLKEVSDQGKKILYTYDEVGRLIKETNKVTGIKSEYSYYPSGNLKSLMHVKGKEIENVFEYCYDKRGNQIQKIQGKETTHYYYDALNRLKTVIDPDTIQNYSYDDLNNIKELTEIEGNYITESSYTYDIYNRLLLKDTRNSAEEIQQRFTYDLEGNMTEKEEVIRHDGNLAASKTQSYLYNGYNQVSYVKDTDEQWISYTYNSNGLRTKKDFGDKAIQYYYDRGSIILETDENYRITAKNIRGNNSKLIYRETEADQYYYLHNAHGDVIKLLDEQANIIKDYTYEAFGQEKPEPNLAFGSKQFTAMWQEEIEAIDNPFRYAGEYLDEETGNYYLRARYYDPSIQRFISEDSIKGFLSEPLSLNLYSYCYNNPIRYIDPSGHIKEEEIDMYHNGQMSPGAYTYLMHLTYEWYLNEDRRDEIHAEADDFRNNNYQKTKSAKYQNLIDKYNSVPDTIDKNIHYSRNELNLEYDYTTLEKLNSIMPDFLKWKQLGPMSSAFHMNGEDGIYNTKWVSGCEHFEAIYNKNRSIVHDSENLGTYNFYGPSNVLKHSKYDVDPYYKWGNTSTSLERSRIGGGAYYVSQALLNYQRYINRIDSLDGYKESDILIDLLFINGY